MPILRIAPFLGSLLLVALLAIPSPANANVLCERKSCLLSQDINGIRLGMTVEEVGKLLPDGLKAIGGGDYEAHGRDVTYDLGFTPLGHLYRIDSSQKLGQFGPDRDFGLELSKKLITKYGNPETNQLPGGPASWNFVEYSQTTQGTLLTRPAESFSAMLGGGYGQPIKLDLQLMDLRILRRDGAAINAAPEARAQEQVHF